MVTTQNQTIRNKTFKIKRELLSVSIDHKSNHSHVKYTDTFNKKDK